MFEVPGSTRAWLGGDEVRSDSLLVTTRAPDTTIVDRTIRSKPLWHVSLHGCWLMWRESYGEGKADHHKGCGPARLGGGGHSRFSRCKGQHLVDSRLE